MHYAATASMVPTRGLPPIIIVGMRSKKRPQRGGAETVV
jgi:hypothetical protein